MCFRAGPAVARPRSFVWADIFAIALVRSVELHLGAQPKGDTPLWVSGGKLVGDHEGHFEVECGEGVRRR